MMRELPIVSPSHKRPDRVLAQRAFSNLIVCVPKSQADEYREHNPDIEILEHPDTIVGLAPKRQWIYSKFRDCYMVDDDVTAIRRIWSKKPTDLTPEEGRAAVTNVYRAAAEMDAYLFGVCTYPHPVACSGLSPYAFSGWLNGCGMGLRWSKKLRFPSHEDCKAVEDFYISLLNAYHHRYMLVDMRFALAQKSTFKNPGGQADHRNNVTEEADFKFLKRKFGGAIDFRRPHHQNKASHPWQKRIKLPF